MKKTKKIAIHCFLIGGFALFIFGLLLFKGFSQPEKSEASSRTQENTLNIYHFEVCRDQNDFFGEWISTDSSNGGIVKLLIERTGEDFSVKAWGACDPSPCEWDKTRFYLVGDSSASKSFEKGFAHWDYVFADTYIFVQFEGLASVYYTQKIEGKDVKFRKEVPQIKLTTITIFKDNSGRANYQGLILLHKEK